MSNDSIPQSDRRSRAAPLLFGLIIGAAIVGLLVYLMMPSMMINIHESKFSTVEETATKLKAAIEKHGWACPGIRDMNKSMAKYGVTFPSPVRIVELCKANYAADVLTTNPELLTLMPCAMGVYEGEDGKIYISGMNTGLMGKMFGGNVAEVMGGSVSHAEEGILAEVVR
jgi:uncharacterized protein (DUF302 family)